MCDYTWIFFTFKLLITGYNKLLYKYDNRIYKKRRNISSFFLSPIRRSFRIHIHSNPQLIPLDLFLLLFHPFLPSSSKERVVQRNSCILFSNPSFITFEGITLTLSKTWESDKKINNEKLWKRRRIILIFEIWRKNEINEKKKRNLENQHSRCLAYNAANGWEVKSKGRCIWYVRR